MHSLQSSPCDPLHGCQLDFLLGFADRGDFVYSSNKKIKKTHIALDLVAMWAKSPE